MNASLPARAASALLIAGLFAGGLATPSLAQTGSSGAAPSATAPAGDGTGATPPAATAPPSSAAPSATAPSTAGPSGPAAGTAPTPRAQAHGRRSGESGQAVVERRITDLHTKLHITPAQSKQWNPFAQAMRENAKDTDQAYRARAQSMGSMTALQNLESYARLEQTRARDVERLVTPFRTLYASLSTQQKQEADQLFRTYAQRYAHGRRGTAR